MNAPLFERMEQFVAGASPALTALWAKSGDEDGWLSVPQHLADAACVAACVWDVWVADSVKRYLGEKLGMDDAEVKALLTFLAGIHDLGKISLRFARQIEHSEHGRTIVDAIADTGLSMTMARGEAEASKFMHGLVGEVIFAEWLKKQGCSPGRASTMAAIIGAHHGIASTGDDRKAVQKILRRYPVDWVKLQNEALDGILQTTGARDLLSRLPRRLNADVAMPLAGLIVMSDWIASNADSFPMVARGNQAERIRAGMEALDITGTWNVESREGEDADEFYRRAFGWPQEFGARPIQKAVLDALDTVDGPCLLIIEAPTGEGKTEAALAAGQRIAAETGAQGLLLATPTMSTSNGLFQRTLDWAARNTPDTDVTSMNLVHSRRLFSQEFGKFRARGIEEDAENGHGSVVASQWFNGTKKAMLSNFVVATVDQVLMMALQMRYSMLRHIGLAGKVIVIDEVHAYDLYMGSYLKMALRWLARYNVSVVLLSATLPHDVKLGLATAYEALCPDMIPEKLSDAYPLLTVVDKQGVREIEVESRPTDIEATIEVISDDMETLRNLVDDLCVDGGCALIICNTVRRAQEVHEEFGRRYPDAVELHHSAFMASERTQKEENLRKELGPDSHRGAGRPDLKIIVATQVAEQSLDIDADVLITDIAPMDLLIQRIGRIHRHSRPVDDRPEKLRQAQVYIRGLEQTSPVPVFEGGSAAVYEPAILMSTMAHLPETFRRPDDVSALVQAVYSPEFTPPEAWAEEYAVAWGAMKEQHDRAESRARTFQIPPPELASDLSKLFTRYHAAMEKVPAGEEAGAAQVRDADPTFEVIPIIGTDYGYRPVPLPGEETLDLDYMDDAAPDSRTAFRLASSVLRLPARFSRYDSIFKRTINRLEADTPVGWMQHFLLKGQVALRLDENGEINLEDHQLRYSSELGLQILDQPRTQYPANAE